MNYINLNTVVDKDGHHVVMNRNGEIAVVDETGRERERYGVVYGARIRVAPDGAVQTGHLLAEWDPYTMPILTEIPGRVRFGSYNFV